MRFTLFLYHFVLQLERIHVVCHVIEIDSHSLLILKLYALYSDLHELRQYFGEFAKCICDSYLINTALLGRFVNLHCYDIVKAHC